MILNYATLEYNTEAYNALIADLTKYPSKVFISIAVPIADIVRGNEELGNGSAFTDPNAVLSYFISYDNTITDLSSSGVASFSPIADLNEWKQNNTLA